MISPIFQQTQVTLTGTSAIASADRTALRNLDRRPWLIDEVRFVNLTSPTPSGSGGGYGAQVGARIKVCGLDVTAEFVPLWTLDPYQNPLWFRNLQTYIYRPPVPILVPPEECVAVDLAGDVFAAALGAPALAETISIGICGRPLEDGQVPDEIKVPWVAKWQPQFTSDGGNVQSTQDDLVNPFDAELYVDRLVGNVLIGGDTATYEDASTNQTDVTEELLTLQLNDTRGGVLVRDPTPFGHVFSAIDRTWKSRTILPPSAYLLASLDMLNWTPVQDETGDAIYVNIGMHGYRKVARGNYHG